MAATTFDTKDRNVIPRWRDSTLTRSTPEAASATSSQRPIIDQSLFTEKRRDWERSPSSVTAIELVNAAIVLNRLDEAKDAATYLISTKERIPTTVTSVAQSILNEGHATNQLIIAPVMDARVRVRQLRARINRYPRNSLAWVDLAREYAMLGQIARSKQAMIVAVALEPNSRFVLRSAARLYVHMDDPERAHQILLRSPSTSSDPWLIAAELATARIANVAPEFAFHARQLLRNQVQAPRHLSEMTSALATLELDNGAVRQARKLFKQALRDPTENTVAQVGWASQQLGSIPLDESVLAVPRLFEAKAWGAFWAGDWTEALENSRKWLDDQPFSSRPAVHGSYIASSLLEDYAAAESIIKTGLVANPRDPTLLNNLAVTLAKTGRVTEARKHFSNINPGSLSHLKRIVWQATSGLLAFREGDYAEGRLLYKKALDGSSANDLYALRVQAAVALAFEEIEANTTEKTLAARFALGLAKDPSPAIETLRRRLIEKLDENSQLQR